MAYLSRTTTTGVAAQQTYSYTFPVQDAAEIRAAVDGTELDTTQLTVDVDAGTVTIGTGVGGHTFVGAEDLRIWRRAPRADGDRYIDPQDTGALSETELETLQLHLLHGVQELLDCLGGDDIVGPAGGLLTWEADGVPPTVLPRGSTGQTLTVAADGSLSWETDGAGAGAGEANTQSDGGATGVGLTLPKVGVDLPLKTLVQGSNVTLTDDGTEVTINASVPGGTITGGNNVGTSGAGLYDGVTAGLIDIRKINSLSGIVTVAEDAGNQKVDLDVDQDQVRLATASTAGFMSAADFVKLGLLDPNADETTPTNVDNAGAVMEYDFTTAHALLCTQTSAGVPISTPISDNKIIGRTGGGNITGLASATLRDFIGWKVERVFNISSPVTGDDTPAFYTTTSITVESLHAVFIGAGGTSSFTWNIKHSSDRNDLSPNTVLSLDRPTSSTTTADTVTSGFADNTIPGGSFVWVDVVGLTGTVDLITIELKATIDP